MTKAPVLALALVPACITVGDQRHADATWTIAHLDGTVAGCPPDWITARLVLADAANPSVQVVDRFRCSDGTGVSSHLPASSYVGWIEFLDAGDQVVATSLKTSVDVSAVGGSFASKVYVDAGYATLSWSYTNPAGSCSEGIDPFVDIVLSLTGPTSVSTLFDCHDTSGTTSPLPPGTYHAWLGQGVVGHDIPDVTIEAPNRVTDLGHVTF